MYGITSPRFGMWTARSGVKANDDDQETHTAPGDQGRSRRHDRGWPVRDSPLSGSHWPGHRGAHAARASVRGEAQGILSRRTRFGECGMRGNPDHPVVREVESQWHKLCAMALFLSGKDEIQITPEDLERFIASGKANIVVDTRGGE